MKIKTTIRLMTAMTFIATSHTAFAWTNKTCDDAGFFFNLKLLNFWDSQFPLRIAGNDIYDGDGVGSPYGAHTKTWCKCGSDPFAYYGIPNGMWVPTRVVDVVRHPECTPSQGLKAKIQLKLLNKTIAKLARRSVNGYSKLPFATTFEKFHDQYASDGDKGSFRQFHSWQFPSELKRVFFRNPCADKAENPSLETSITNLAYNASGMTQWLQNLYYPEYYLIMSQFLSSATGSDEATAALTIINGASKPLSCTANTVGVGQQVDDYAYWLGGCFESTLPTTGHTKGSNSLSNSHSVLERSVFLSARNSGYASKNTVGNNALCGPKPVGLFPKKSHYKFSMVFPYTEAVASNIYHEKTQTIMKNNKTNIGGVISSVMSGGSIVGKVMDWLDIESTTGAHRFGAAQSSWGANRHSQGDPNVASWKSITNNNDHDATYIVWRWVDCCYSFY